MSPDFSPAVVEDLYRYNYKRPSTALLLLVFTGILGGHRFYLDKPLTGVLYFLTAGGALVLWIWDFWRYKQLIEDYNAREEACREVGLPPQSLSFLPPVRELDLNAPPTWLARRSKRAVLVGGIFLLAVIGLAMGAIAGSTGIIEPSIIMVVFMVITLIAARWPVIGNIPVLRDLSRWNHRLRLYYFTTDPGSIWLLALRPYTGLFLAPWQKKSRAEVRLYLRLGITFGIAFAVVDLIEVQEYGFWAGFGLIVAELAQTIAYTYIFVAPVGAIILTQQLIARRDRVIVFMCAMNLLCGYLGLFLVGAI